MKSMDERSVDDGHIININRWVKRGNSIHVYENKSGSFKFKCLKHIFIKPAQTLSVCNVDLFVAAYQDTDVENSISTQPPSLPSHH